MTTRRQFLAAAASTSALVSLARVTPNFLLHAADQRTDKSKSENILVVVQLSGGNDGLNTVVPLDQEQYRQQRPTLAIGSDQTLKINKQAGFHPSLRGFADLLETDRLAIIQGVGYPNPNRSHFESMDIWHTCHRERDSRQTGWIGRYLDASADQQAARDSAAIHFGAEVQPLALSTEKTPVSSVRSLEQFKLNLRDSQQRPVIESVVAAERENGSDLLQFIQSSTTAALTVSQRVEQGLESYKTSVTYPQTQLAGKLRTIAQLIDAGMSTKIYYVTVDGFDTHSNQSGAHAGLLAELGGAVHAFLEDLAVHDHDQRVTVMSFSEFGRRVKENASQGTDHGAAAPMFLAGAPVKTGVIGDQPSLTDLIDGDIRHHTDFRQVYASVLEDWIGWDSVSILGKRFDKINVIA